ncbi:MAG: hypothetical protein AAF191_17640 [Verrucomicrobiota bacterium]
MFEIVNKRTILLFGGWCLAFLILFSVALQPRTSHRLERIASQALDQELGSTTDLRVHFNGLRGKLQGTAPKREVEQAYKAIIAALPVGSLARPTESHWEPVDRPAPSVSAPIEEDLELPPIIIVEEAAPSPNLPETILRFSPNQRSLAPNEREKLVAFVQEITEKEGRLALTVYTASEGSKGYHQWIGQRRLEDLAWQLENLGVTISSKATLASPSSGDSPSSIKLRMTL